MSLPNPPCNWDIDASICCPDWDDYSTELQTQSMEYASLVLWSATGRVYGTCETTVRPCGRFCDNCPSGYYWDGEGTWVPYVWNGVWRNCWCGAEPGCCSCNPHCRVYLPGNVESITEVRVGGETLPTSGAYFVLDSMWLVRVDTEECWPLCSDQNLAPGDVDSFEVTYRYGRALPNALVNATAILACEYAKACRGEPCRLPGRIASISRQGVNINMVDVTELLRSGLTGIKEVDDVIRALNPKALVGKTRFYSPDLPNPKTVTWP